MTEAEVLPAGVPPSPSATSQPDLERQKRDFYMAVLDAADRILFPAALQIEDLDQEIALLRLKLRKLMKAKRKTFDPKLMVRSMDMLNRLVSTRYRISKGAQRDLAASLAAVLQGVRSELGLGDDHGP